MWDRAPRHPLLEAKFGLLSDLRKTRELAKTLVFGLDLKVE